MLPQQLFFFEDDDEKSQIGGLWTHAECLHISCNSNHNRNVDDGHGKTSGARHGRESWGWFGSLPATLALTRSGEDAENAAYHVTLTSRDATKGRQAAASLPSHHCATALEMNVTDSD